MVVSDAVGEPGGDKETEVEPGQHKGDSNSHNNLSPTAMAALATGLFCLLAWNIVYDSLSDGSQGYPVTLVLGGLLGGIVGIRRFIGGGDK